MKVKTNMALIQKDGISFPNKKFSYKTLVIYICPIANIYKAIQTQMYNEKQ